MEFLKWLVNTGTAGDLGVSGGGVDEHDFSVKKLWFGDYGLDSRISEFL